MQNPHFASKTKIQKNMSKSILQTIYSYSVQKTARKKPKYSRNESILKIGHHAKGQKLKFQKTCQNLFYKSFTVIVRKNPLEKAPNIGEMRAFLKSAIMHRL